MKGGENKLDSINGSSQNKSELSMDRTEMSDSTHLLPLIWFEQGDILLDLYVTL